MSYSGLEAVEDWLHVVNVDKAPPAVGSEPLEDPAGQRLLTVDVPGPNHKLRFCWAINGTPTWHPETLAGQGTTFSAPSMTVNGNAVNISGVGELDRLKFYWAINGTNTWHAETVAGKGSVR
jgi:hypothetical protein